MQDETLSQIVIGRWLPKIVLSWPGKIVVLLLEAGFLVAAIYGCTKVSLR